MQVVVHLYRPVTTAVQFLHRTVYDWLQGIRPSIVADGPAGYDPSLVLYAVTVSRLRRLASEDDWISSVELIAGAHDAFRLGGYCNNSSQSRN